MARERYKTELQKLKEDIVNKYSSQEIEFKTHRVTLQKKGVKIHVTLHYFNVKGGFNNVVTTDLEEYNFKLIDRAYKRKMVSSKISKIVTVCCKEEVSRITLFKNKRWVQEECCPKCKSKWPQTQKLEE